MPTVKIQTSRFADGEEYEQARFVLVESYFATSEDRSGWWVHTGDIDGNGWRRYAIEDARPIDVKQLLRKEYDVRY